MPQHEAMISEENAEAAAQTLPDLIVAPGSDPADPLMLSNLPLYKQQILGSDPSAATSSASSTDYIEQAIAAAPAVPYSDIAVWGYVGAAMIALVCTFVAFMASKREKTAPAKLSAVASQVGWGILFAGGMLGMSVLGSMSMIVGSVVFYIAALSCTAFAGLLMLVARARSVLRASREESLSAALRFDAMSQPSPSIEPPNSSPPASSASQSAPSSEPSPSSSACPTHSSQSTTQPALTDFYGFLPEAPSERRRTAAKRMLWRLSSSRVLPFAVALMISAGAIVASAMLALLMLEIPSNPALFEIGDPYLYAEFLVLLGTTAGVWLAFQRKGAALLATPAVALIYGIAEYFVESFKKAAIMPADLASASTGFAVAGGYTYEATSAMTFCFALFVLFAAIMAFVEDPLTYVIGRKSTLAVNAQKTDTQVPDEVVFGRRLSFTSRFAAHQTRSRAASARRKKWLLVVSNTVSTVLSVVLGICLIVSTWSGAYATDWEDEGVELDTYLTAKTFHEYGIIPSFMNAMQMQDLEPPSGYTTDKAKDLQDAFARAYDATEGANPQRLAAQAQFAEQPPNVVIVMNETFADLSYLNGLNAGYEGPHFFKGSKAYAKGKLSVSVYGGGTCNTEFEMLAETPLAYVGDGLNPYVMYDLTESNSAVKNFESYGYGTTAIHPEAKTNWKRSSIYPGLGFDEFLDKDSFPDDALTHRNMIADAETYEKVMNVLRDNEDPQFVWDLTMANHGGYDTDLLEPDEMLHYPFNQWVDEWAAGVTNEYVSTIKLADEEVEAFISELCQFDEPTVVVFFGDHHPGFTDWYTETIYADHPELERRQLAYQTDYAIWANYDIAGAGDQCYEAAMNAGQLMSYTLNLIGAPMTDYEKAQYVSRNWSISANVFGYLDEIGIWHDIAEAQDVPGVYERALEILGQAARGQILRMDPADPASIEAKLDQDRVIFDAMHWVSYMNFQEKVVN